jgi:hypothetical protein
VTWRSSSRPSCGRCSVSRASGTVVGVIGGMSGAILAANLGAPFWLTMVSAIVCALILIEVHSLWR